jgi:predicted 3-demethylubiquinone-9 3-methyltransferase (glyoxalase superfamily)
MTVTFELEGQGLMALNGGPVFKFSPAISLFSSTVKDRRKK